MNSITEKPWGSFEILNSGKKFLVKKIFVKPGGVLSLQSHEHRSEHWIVAEGEAEVTIDKKVINLKENENIFIPKGAIHRMANRKDRDLVIIEMWFGDNLDENDIRDEGSRALGEALKENETLTELDLSQNQIGEEG